ncbi:2Fe-2S iron-sulfur cluster-binding protein [Streptomyces sp. NPDC000594]|uniref:2Fe-2S iron-sulfur cluster-binding protein n=1 Tax=Streptomyces sp. NPDC000594 TaxID=3154261 RepID=UPI00332AE773
MSEENNPQGRTAQDGHRQDGHRNGPAHGVWQPTPQGEYDYDATAFVQLPPEEPVGAAPLEAPGHDYVPPMILPLTPAAEPQVPAAWRVPHDTGDAAAQGHPGHGWPEPADHHRAGPHGTPPYGTEVYGAEGYRPEEYEPEAYGAGPRGAGTHDAHDAHDVHVHGAHDAQGADAHGPLGHGTDQHGTDPHGTDGRGIEYAAPAAPPAGEGHDPHDPHATEQWVFPEAVQQGQDRTGQWTIPVARGDLPDETGEFTTAMLSSQWSGAPATLPGGATAPWAVEPAPEESGAPDAPGATAAPPAEAPAPEVSPLPAPAVHPEPPVEHTAPEETGGAAPEALEADGGTAGPAEHTTYGGQALPGAVGVIGVPGGSPGAPGSSEAAGGPEAPEAVEPAEPAVAPEVAEADEASEAVATHEPDEPGEIGEPGEVGEVGEIGEAVSIAAPGTPVPHDQAPAPAEAPEEAPAEERYVEEGYTEEEYAPDGAGPALPDETVPEGPEAEVAPAAAEAGHAEQAGQAEHGEPQESPEDQEHAQSPAYPESTEYTETAAPEPVLPPVQEQPLISYRLRVNGADCAVTDAWIGESLLYVLRERLGLAGAKDGCSQGECGACNVQVDGRLVASCLVPAATTAGCEVRTVEGLAADGEPSDVQRALAACGAVQCGFCVPGMAMTVHDLLEGNHSPTELETRQALCGNLCRCSGYRGVLDAVREVVAEREASAAALAGDGPDGDGSARNPLPEARIPHQAPPGAGSVQPHPHDGGMA